LKRILLSLGLFLSCAASARAGELIHNPVLSAAEGQDIQVGAVYVGSEKGVVVSLFYRAKNKELYRKLDLTGSITDLKGVIPGKFVDVAGVEYYLEARDQAKALLTKTMVNNVVVRKDELKPELQVLSPMEGSTAESARPVITVSFEDVDSGVDTASLLLKIDGSIIKDSRDIQVFDTLMSYVPAADLAEGSHEAVVVIKDKSGNPSSVKWSFSVSSKTSMQGAKEKSGMKWDGGLGYETLYGHTLLQPKSPLASLPYRPYGVNRGRISLNGRGSENTVKINALVTDEERSDQQPSDRFLASIQNDEGLITAGDYAPNFSELSLYGLSQFRGVSLDLRSGPLQEGHTRLVGLWGQTKRPIEPGRSAFSSSPAPATLAQYLYGVRWEFGGPYFLMGLNAVAVNDQLGSVSGPAPSAVFNTLETCDVTLGVPQIFLKLTGEGGWDYAALGTSLLGISSGLAYKAGLDWNVLPWQSRLTFDWRDLGGGLGLIPGGYYNAANEAGLVADYRGYESSFHQGLFDGQFSLDLGLNSWRDNLQGQKQTNQNDYLSVFANIAPTNLPYLNLGYSQSRTKNDGDGNTTFSRYVIDNQSGSTNVGLGYTYVMDPRKSLNASVTWINTLFKDQAAQKLSQDLAANNYVFSAFMTLGGSSFNASASLGNTEQPGYYSSATGAGVTQAARTGLSNSYSLTWNQEWAPRVFSSNLGFDLGTNHNESAASSTVFATAGNGTRTTYRLGGNYTPLEGHRFAASLAYASVAQDFKAAAAKTEDSLAQLYSQFSYNWTF